MSPGTHELVGESPQLRLVIDVGSRLEEVERQVIEATLKHYQGNKRLAAQTLGCSLKTLYNKLNGYSHAAVAVQSFVQQG